MWLTDYTRPFAKKLVKNLEGVLLPPICLLCGAHKVERHYNLCTSCWQRARFISKPYCVITGVPFSFEWEEGTISRRAQLSPPSYDYARAVLRYEGVFARPLILRLKYGDRPELASALAGWLARAAHDIIIDCDFLVPVPLHWYRLWQRRFNQAAELARALSLLTHKPYGADVLQRTRYTKPQIGLSRGDRKRNMRNAFVVKKKWRNKIKGKHLILIDDVFTTGATMESCVKALRRAGARRVDIAVLARVVHEEEMLV